MSFRRSIKLLSLIKGLLRGDLAQAAGLMGEMHGLPQKVGQHLTLYRRDELADYFTALCTESKPETVPAAEVLAELRIDYTELAPHAHASIGQVYRVTTGRGPLAMKVRYPGIEKKVSSDFSLLRGLARLSRILPMPTAQLSQIVDYTRRMVLAECDYPGEARHQQRMARLFAGHEDIYVPEIVTYNQRAIVSRWVPGPSLAGRPELADKGFLTAYLAFTLVSLKKLGLVHTDPHPGNFILMPDGGTDRLAVLDFGSTAAFAPPEQAALTRLLLGGYEALDPLVDDLATLGLNRETLEIYRPVIGDLVSILLEPFYDPQEYDFRGWRLQYKMNTLLGSRAWEKPLQFPLKMLLFMRTLQGLYYYARRSSIAINWQQISIKHLG